MTPSPATSATQTAATLAGVEWDHLDADELLEVAVALGRLRSVLDGALVNLADRLEDTGAPEAIGWASTKDFLTHLLGGRKGTGGGIVRVADRTTDLPAVRTALTAGDLRSRRPR